MVIIGFLTFSCGLLGRSCWAEAKYARILKKTAYQASDKMIFPKPFDMIILAFVKSCKSLAS